MRPHFVRARVKVRTAYKLSFTGPDALAATTRKEGSGRGKRRLNPLGGDPVENVNNADASTRVPQAEQKQKQRSIDALPKPAYLAIDSPRRKRVIV